LCSRLRKFSGPRCQRAVKLIALTEIEVMETEKAIEIEGTIMHVLPGTMFRVALSNNNLVLAHISGKMRKRFIRLTVGDRVKMQMSPYDTAKARIVYRL
jgi:translation initiation factor IF-1